MQFFTQNMPYRTIIEAKFSRMAPSKSIRTVQQSLSDAFVGPLSVCCSLVYLMYEVHESNVTLCYEREQCHLNVESAMKLTVNCCVRLIILHETVVAEHSALSFTAPWFQQKRKKRLARYHRPNGTCLTHHV